MLSGKRMFRHFRTLTIFILSISVVVVTAAVPQWQLSHVTVNLLSCNHFVVICWQRKHIYIYKFMRYIFTGIHAHHCSARSSSSANGLYNVHMYFVYMDVIEYEYVQIFIYYVQCLPVSKISKFKFNCPMKIHFHFSAQSKQKSI